MSNGVLCVFRIIGILCVCISVASVGFIYYEHLVFRKRYLERMTMFSKNCANEMRSQHDSIFNIIGSYAVKELKFLKDISMELINDKEALNTALENAKIHIDDRDLIIEFLQRLGVSDIISQKTLCDYFSDRFLSVTAIAQRQVDEKGRLVRSLCLLLSAALFIILI